MKFDQRNRLQVDLRGSKEFMALSFFHGGQLAKGVQASGSEGGSRVQSLRRFQSETALRDTKSEAASQRSFTGSKRGFSSRGDVRTSQLSETPSLSAQRPATSYTNRHGLSLHPPNTRPRTAGSAQPADPTNPYRSRTTITAETPPPAPSRWNSFLKSGTDAIKSGSEALKNMKKPSFISLRREAAQPTEKPAPISDKRSWRRKEAARRSQLRQDALAADTQPRPSTANAAVTQARPISRAASRREAQQQRPPSRLEAQRTISRSASQKETQQRPPSRVASLHAAQGHDSTAHPVALPHARVDTPIAAQGAVNPGMFLAESLAHVIVGEWLYKDPHKPGLFPKSNILQRNPGPPPRGATGIPQKRWFRIDPYERQLTWSSKWDTMETNQHKMSRQVPVKLVFEIPNRLATEGCIPAHVMPYHYSIVVVAPSKVIKVTAPDELRHSQWLTALQYLVDSTKKVTEESWPDVLAARLAFLTQPMDASFDEQRDEIPTRAGTPFIADKPLPEPPEERSTITSMVPPPVPRYTQHARETSDESGPFSPISEYSKETRSIKSHRNEQYTLTEPKGKEPVAAEPDGVQDDLAVDQMEAILSRLN